MSGQHVKRGVASEKRTAQLVRQQDPALAAKAHEWEALLCKAIGGGPGEYVLVDAAAWERAESIKAELQTAGWDFRLALEMSRESSASGDKAKPS
jgi:hypothetical protein